MSETIRAFIAIGLDKPIIELIDSIQKDLRQCDCPVKWVKPKNAHVTLKFLGDIEQSKVTKIIKTLDDVAASFKETTVSTTGLGAFPSRRFPKVLWLGLDDGGFLAKVAAAVGHSLVKLKFRKEKRKFSPHITIGRVRSTKNLKNLREKLTEEPSYNSLEQPIDSIRLYKSILTPTGPIYKCLFEAPLKSTGNV